MSSSKKVVAIVQARVSSIRFPYKVLQKIGNKTAIQILLERLSFSKKIDKIVVAIPKDKKEKILKNHIVNLGNEVFEGHKTDLVDRYYKAAKKFKADVIVRVTGDCPLIDVNILDEMVEKFLLNKFHLVLNYKPPTFPNGLDLAITDFIRLKEVWNKARKSSDRENVMPYLIRNKSYKKFNFKNNVNFSKERWTLDEKEDFQVISNIFKNLKNYHCNFNEIIRLRKSKPKIFYANKNIPRDEGSKLNTGQKLWKRVKQIIPFHILNTKEFKKISKNEVLLTNLMVWCNKNR